MERDEIWAEVRDLVGWAASSPVLGATYEARVVALRASLEIDSMDLEGGDLLDVVHEFADGWKAIVALGIDDVARLCARYADDGLGRTDERLFWAFDLMLSAVGEWTAAEGFDFTHRAINYATTLHGVWFVLDLWLNADDPSTADRFPYVEDRDRVRAAIEEFGWGVSGPE